MAQHARSMHAACKEMCLMQRERDIRAHTPANLLTACVLMWGAQASCEPCLLDLPAGAEPVPD